MKKTKFYTNPVAKKIKKEAKQREAERFMDSLDVPTFHKERVEVPNVFLLGLFIGAALPLIHFFVIMPLLTNL